MAGRPPPSAAGDSRGGGGAKARSEMGDEWEGEGVGVKNYRIKLLSGWRDGARKRATDLVVYITHATNHESIA